MHPLYSLSGLERICGLVVLVGCQRSGTTLCAQVAGAHPNAFLIDENDGLYRWFHGLFTHEKSTANATTQALLTRADKKHAPGLTKTQVDRAGKISLKDSITHLVLKAPNLTYHYQALQHLGLPTTIVYPVRDVYPVIQSMARLSNIPFVKNQIKLLQHYPEIQTRFCHPFKTLTDEAAAPELRRAALWYIKTALVEQYRQTTLALHAFHYEDFVKDSVSHSRSIAALAALDHHDNMLNHHRCYVGEGPGGTDRTRPIDRQSLTSLEQSFERDTHDRPSITKGTQDPIHDQIHDLTYDLRRSLGYATNSRPS